MHTVLNAIAILGGALTLITGVWGLVELGEASNPEVQELQMWVCIALVSSGVALVALGLARILPARGPVVSGPTRTMNTYPHTIENGAGSEATFVRLVPDAEGDRLEVENRVRPGSGPPLHVHYLQEEGLTVQEGKLGYQRLGEEARYAGEGETVAFKPGEAHKFWNAGEGELRCTGYAKPAHNVEYFLSALYESQKQNGGKRPDPFDAAYLMVRYKSEFGMPEILGFVQRFILPVQVQIGKALGKYKEYKDAPEPVEG